MTLALTATVAADTPPVATVTNAASGLPERGKPEVTLLYEIC